MLIDLLKAVLALGIMGLILGGAAGYIYKAKKKGVKCIGCPQGSKCSGNCPGCSCAANE